MTCQEQLQIFNPSTHQRIEADEVEGTISNMVTKVIHNEKELAESLTKTVTKTRYLSSNYSPSLKIDVGNLWNYFFYSDCELAKELHKKIHLLLNNEQDERYQPINSFTIFSKCLNYLLRMHPESLPIFPPKLLLETLINHAHLIVEESDPKNGDMGCSLSGILIIILNSDYLEEDQLKEFFVSPLLKLLTNPNLDKKTLQSISYVLGSILLPQSGSPSPLTVYTIKEIERNIASFQIAQLGVESFLPLIGSYLTSKRILHDDNQEISITDISFLARLIVWFVNSTFYTLSKSSKFRVIQIVHTLYEFDMDDIDTNLDITLKYFHIYCQSDLEAGKFTIFWNKYFEIINSFVTKERFRPLLTLNSQLNSQFQFNEWFKTALVLL